MSEAQAEMLPVELVGGPLDGHRAEVRALSPGFDVWLFQRNETGRREVLAYSFAGRSTDDGRHWVLAFLYEVAWEPREKGGEA